MAVHEFDHPSLGRLNWGATGWSFRFPLTEDQSGRGTVIADTPEPSPSPECLQAIGEYLAWFREHEEALRAHIADKLFDPWLSDWCDPEIDGVETPLAFQQQLRLSGINFYCDERQVSLIYNDGDLFGGHGIELSTNLDGELASEPVLFGRDRDSSVPATRGLPPP